MLHVTLACYPLANEQNMTPGKRPTLQDIADKVGVTKMTVSRYMRSPASVAATTREKIADAIETLGYIKNRVPAILSKSSSKTIGVLVPSLSNQVFADLVQGVEDVAGEQGYDTLIAHTGYSESVEEEKVALMLSYQVDGLILTETQHSSRTLQMLSQAGIPVVETMEIPATPIDMAVGLDHQAAAFAMVSAIIASGKQHVAYLAARMDSRTLLRKAGYEKAMKQAGLEPATVATLAHSSFTLGGELLDQALAQYPDTDAVFCTNDDIAVGVMLRCKHLGLRVPEDMAVAGYNGLNIGEAMTPLLTSVITPRAEMGRVSASNILQSLRGERPNAPVTELPWSINRGFTV